MIFTGSEKKTLLLLATKAIDESLNLQIDSLSKKPELSENLKSGCGAFVSLYVDEELRGCIGTFSEKEPLYKNVEKMAVSAATQDSRFESIHSDELVRLELEISILTPRQKINDPSEIVLGKHGIYIKRGTSRGTLLPQVAVSQNWDVMEFVSNCSKYKAGIGWDGWKTAELYTYEAIVFKSKIPSF